MAVQIIGQTQQRGEGATLVLAVGQPLAIFFLYCHGYLQGIEKIEVQSGIRAKPRLVIAQAIGRLRFIYGSKNVDLQFSTKGDNFFNH